MPPIIENRPAPDLGSISETTTQGTETTSRLPPQEIVNWTSLFLPHSLPPLSKTRVFNEEQTTAALPTNNHGGYHPLRES